MKPLLVIVHEATRTGSPKVIHDLLRHVRGRLARPVAIRLLAGGPMTAQLESLGDVSAVAATPAAVLINSSLAAEEAWHVDADVPVAVYVHEQGEALRTLPEPSVSALRERCSQVWCVSEAARDELERLGIPSARLSVLPPVVNEVSTAEGNGSEHRRRLGLDPSAQLVAGCGEASWRKGADLFLDVARRLAPELDLRVVWIGRRPRAFARVLDHDSRRLGLDKVVSWTGELADPRPLLAEAQVLVVTSREDPQPLVPLEAALAGTPTAGFAVGGMADMGDQGEALTVPYPDTAALAEAIRSLLHDPVLVASLTRAASARARGRHSLEQTAAEFEHLLGRLLTESGTDVS